MPALKNIVTRCREVQWFGIMFYLGLILLCVATSSWAQRLEETNNDISANRRSTGYGLLKPGYQSGYNGYQNGYNGYNNYQPGYNGYNNYQGGYGGYQGGYGGYQGHQGYQPGYGNNGYGGYPGAGYQGGGYQGGYAGPFGGFPGGYANPNLPFIPGFRPNRPGYDYRSGLTGANTGYTGYNRPGYQQGIRPGYPGNQGNYFGSYGDGYNDNYRFLARKVSDDKKSEETVQ